ncbi:MAG: NAD(P)-dependent oxidoreductase, partial [Candidatus Poribacteria bacterium]|nr:NAD(P)-dependent oxidoreductase [Candidatus Poribacteria bacterium]
VSAELAVVNTSTVGASTAAESHQQLSEKGVGYADAPVSGGASGAQNATLTIIFSGDARLFTRLQPLFDVIGANSFNVGSQPGQGQRMKMVNNHLAISTLLTTSEALAYGEAGGLDMKTMLEILNVSSGRSYTTEHIFPNFVLPETYDSGGPASIIRKDIGLFVRESIADGCRHSLARATLDLIEAFDDENPDSDQTDIYPFIRDKK